MLTSDETNKPFYDINQIACDWGSSSYIPDSSVLSWLENAEVLFHSYVGENYEGLALTIFRKDGVLYECEGSHCSCNGLEGQWDPEKTSKESLELRNGSWNRLVNEALKAIGDRI